MINVCNTSSADLPLIYKISGPWAGPAKAHMLLWVLVVVPVRGMACLDYRPEDCTFPENPDQ